MSVTRRSGPRAVAVLIALAVVAPASVASVPSFAASAPIERIVDGLDATVVYTGTWRKTSNRTGHNGSVQ